MSILGRLFERRSGAERTGLEAVDRVLLPAAAAAATQAHLRDPGLRGHEGLVVWSGIQEGAAFQVRTVTFPAQRPIRSGGGVCVVVDSAELHRLNVKLHGSGERLIAQVHSHPTGAYHSEMDDDYAIATTAGALSIVVPDFAERAFSMSENATFRLSAEGVWTEVRPREAQALIVIQGD